MLTEVNISPNMVGRVPEDAAAKERLLRDTLRLALARLDPHPPAGGARAPLRRRRRLLRARGAVRRERRRLPHRRGVARALAGGGRGGARRLRRISPTADDGVAAAVWGAMPRRDAELRCLLRGRT